MNILNLSDKDLQIIMFGLGELQAKTSMQTINMINLQVSANKRKKEQEQAENKKEVKK